MNTQTTAIIYKGIAYPVRIIHISQDNEIVPCLVSCDSLNNAIFDEEKGWYRDDEAFEINDDVSFFVPDELIEADDHSLIEYLKQEAA